MIRSSCTRWLLAIVIIASLSGAVASQTPVPRTGLRSLPPLTTGNLEIVAPIGQTTVIELPNPPSEVLTLDQGTFGGTVRLSMELNTHVVSIVPNVGADTADVFVLRDGQQIKTIRIVPIIVSPETAALESQADIPDPESRDYTVYSESREPGRDFYNGAPRANLRSIKISGRRLNIRPRGPQDILERLMPGGAAAADIGLVELYAQEVIIGAPLRIPGADVRIFAQNLRFEDQDDIVGSLDTTPMPPPEVTAPGVRGRDGQKGGDIYLRVNHVSTPNGPAIVRMKANGGTGQRGGPETPGTKGGDKPSYAKEPAIGGILRSWNDLAPWRRVEGDEGLPADWGNYHGEKNVVWFNRFGTFEHGDGSWPGNGTQGRPGGQPGVGGTGGDLHSGSPVPGTILDLAGGNSAEKRSAAPSGETGKPELSIGISLERQGGFFPAIYRFQVRRARKLSDLASPIALRPSGEPGTSRADLQRGWLHPNAARGILTFGEDLYRMGFMEKANAELQILLENIESVDVITEPAESYIAVKQRINALQSRISENRDYYGNPAGYVPALSLASAIGLINSELAASSTILAVSERVRMDAETAALNNLNLTNVRNAAARDVVNLGDKLNDLAESVPRLQQEAQAVADDERSFLIGCQQHENLLRQRAQQLGNPEPSFLSKAVKTLGTLAKVCPVGQPMLGAVGGVIDFASTLDERTPWDSITQVPSLMSGFSGANVETSMQSFRQTVDSVRTMDPSNPRQFFAGISSAADTMGRSLADFKRMQDSSRAPADKVDQIFQNLKATDQHYRDVLNRASALTARKGLLAEKIDQSIHEIGEVSSKISTLTSNVDSLNLQLTNAQDRIDHPALLATKDVGRQTRERLDFYHYLLMKSFEYFTAVPYQGNRRASGTADSLAQLLTNSNNEPQRAAEAFQTVYTNEVRGVGRQIVNKLNDQGQRNKKTVNVTLNANELATLNSSLTNSGDLFINLEDRSLIPVTDLEARLVNLEVIECDCVITSGQAVNATLHIDFTAPATGFIQTQIGRIAFRRSVEARLWGATVDLTTQPTAPRLNQQAEDVGDVLERFINPSSSGQVSHFAPPPAFPGFNIRARFESDAPQPITIRIRRLHLRLTYSSVTSSVVRALRVTSKTPNGLVPFIYVSRPDASGRRSGQANFTRVYDTDAPIELVAPTNLGTSRFIGWFRGQTPVTTSNHLAVPTQPASYRYEARYQ